MSFQIVRDDISGIKTDVTESISDHVTGQDSGSKRESEAAARSGYRSVFGSALEKKAGSLAVLLPDPGSLGLSRGEALKIALSEIGGFLADHDMDIFLSVPEDGKSSSSEDLYGDIDSYIDENFVEPAMPMASAGFMALGEAMKAPELSDEPEPVGKFAIPGFGAGFASVFSKHSEKKAEKKTEKKTGRKAFNESMPYLGAALPEEDRCEEVRLPGCAAPMMARSLDEVVNNLDKTFMEMVFSFADSRGMTDVEVQKKANLDRKAFSKLKCGTTKNPSKSTALALAIALELNLDETTDLLARAGYALSPCSKQDVIVRYFIERKVYDIYEINVALFEHGESLLGCAA